MKAMKWPRLPKVQFASLFMFILLTPLLLYVIVYVPRQQRSFNKRNLRVLKDMSNQIQSKIENYATLIHNSASNAIWQSGGSDSSLLVYLNKNLALIPDVHPKKVSIDTVMTDSSDQAYITRGENEFKMTAYTQRAQGAYQLHIVYHGNFRSPRTLAMHIHVLADFTELLRPILNRDIFDNTFVLEPDGTIIYQQGSSELALTRFNTLLDPNGKPISLSQLQHVSAMLNVKLADIRYKCYVQPAPFFFEPAAKPGTAGEWTLAAFIEANRFRKESMAISYNLIILFIFFVLFSAVSWPLLKLWKMGPHERYRVADVIFLFLFLTVGTSLLSISLMDAYSYISMRSQFDSQLKQFAVTITSHFRTEIDHALQQLQQLNQLRSMQPPNAEQLRLNLLQSRMLPDSAFVYPHFEMVFWSDSTGMQQNKWTVNQVATPLINVSKRRYFNEIANGQGWYWPGLADSLSQRYWLQPIYSWTTGENEAILAIPAVNDANSSSDVVMAALVFQPLSLLSPIIPKGFGYCVIDEKGNTLFHSDPRRNLRENFVSECNNKRLLQSALFGRTETLMNLYYSGSELRAFIMPFPHTKWSLVTFRNKNFLRTANLEILTITLTLFITFILSLLALLSLFRLIFPAYNLDWIWPNPQLNSTYYQFIVLYVLLSLCYLFAIFRVSPTQVLIITLVVPNFVLVLTYIKLKNDRQSTEAPVVDSTGFRFHIVRWRGTRAYFVLGILIISPLILQVVLHYSTWAQATGQTFGLFIISLVMLSLSPKQRYHGVNRLSYRSFYTAALVMLVVLLSVLPSIALFHIVSKQETQLMIKNIQFDLGKQWEARYQRAMNQLNKIAMRPSIRETLLRDRTRISGTLDVYSRFMFNTVLDSLPAETKIVPPDTPRVDDLLHKFRHLESLVRFAYDSVSIQTRGLMESMSGDRHWVSESEREDEQHFIYRSRDGAALSIRSVIPMPLFVRNPYWMLGFLILIILVVFIIRVVSSRIFFLDFYQPDFYQPHYMAVRDLATCPFDRNLLLITPPIAGKTDLLATRKDILRIDVTVEASRENWAAQFDYSLLKIVKRLKNKSSYKVF